MLRFRPRISLLTALLLMTIIGMAIVIVQLWREVEPLRAEVRRRRAETGHLTIDDPEKAYVVNVPMMEERHWRWRIYLPPGFNYTAFKYSGKLPSPNQVHDKAWFTAARSTGSGGSSTQADFDGEFLLDCALKKEGDQWVLRTQTQRHEGDNTSSGGSANSVHPSDWIEGGSQFSYGAITAGKQVEHDPTQPLLLLHLVRPVVTKTPSGGKTITSPTGPADGVALWIEGTKQP